MNISHFLRGIAAALFLVAPTTGWSKDRHDWHRGGDSHRSDRHHFSNHSYRPYYGSRYGYGSGYGYPYSYYGYDYGAYDYYPGPTFGFSFHSRPDSSYPIYRGRIASGYSDRLAADVQRELRRRGYYRGSIDGNIGPQSRAAIRSYQADHRVYATGRIDSTLLRSLGIG